MIKPPYRVPSMQEITALPWNGLTVVSTFSGCGGSCLGYRMAGFRVLWANEFVPAAQASYRANSNAILDSRDIRTIEPQDILRTLNMSQGDIDLFDGSPPCQAFSTAGKREKGWGKGKTYEHGAVQKNEELFTEYIRLLRGLMPKVFVAENVSGLVKGIAKGFFLEILRELKASDYIVQCKLLDAQWLGVPQMRQRTIFIGVRNDLQKQPVFPMPLPYRYSVRDALPWIESVQSAVPSVIHDTGNFITNVDITETPCPTITVGSRAWNSSHYLIQGRGDDVTQIGRRPDGVERRKFTIAELKRICAFPDDFVLTGSYAQQWERLGNAVPPVMMYHIAKTIRDNIFDSMKEAKSGETVEWYSPRRLHSEQKETYC